MAVEPMRGCGYRKVGGLYLCGEGPHIVCDRLPYELKVCPTCGEGIKFSRGWQWISWYDYAGDHKGCSETSPWCPVCVPSIRTPLHRSDKRVYGLLWVGESFYTPEAFIQEALAVGVSKRIAAVPRKLKFGEMWVLLAHMMACGTYKNEQGVELKIPGIFYAFRPQRIEKLIWQKDALPEVLEDLEKAGITPVIIPDGDLDHDPQTKLKVSEEEKSVLVNKRFFGSLRSRLGAEVG